MSELKLPRLLAAAKEFNIGQDTLIEFLQKKGFSKDDLKPTAKLSEEMYYSLQSEFQSDKVAKNKADLVEIPRGGNNGEQKKRRDEEDLSFRKEEKKPLFKEEPKPAEPEPVHVEPVVVRVIEPEPLPEPPPPPPVIPAPAPEPVPVIVEVKIPEPVIVEPVVEFRPEKPVVQEVTKIEAPELEGPKIINKIDLSSIDSSTRPKKIIKKREDIAQEPEIRPEPVAVKPAAPKAAPQVVPAPAPAPVAEPVQEIVIPEENAAPIIENIEVEKITGPKILGKIELPVDSDTRPKPSIRDADRKRKRIPINKGGSVPPQGGGQHPQQGGQGGYNRGPGGPQQGGGQQGGYNRGPGGPQQGGGQQGGYNRGPGGPQQGGGQQGGYNRGPGGPQQGGGQQGGYNRGPGGPQRPGGGQQGGNRPNIQGNRGPNRGPAIHHPRPDQKEIDAKEIQEKIRETQAKLAGSSGRGKSQKAKHRREKRQEMAEAMGEMQEDNKLQVTEFVTVSELANLMDVSFAEVISKCMGLGIMVSINQRLDAEVIELVSSEFGYEVEFISLEDADEDIVEEDEDNPDELKPRAPIVTIMGHVDHGKTSLLDYIRSANVVAGEAGGITQHIGAYEVTLPNGKHITFLDTPGHEAFTAMRARGAKITDIAVIVVAADDAVMPQTKEAISHAQAAGVPMIFAVNKIDKDGANPQKIYEQLSQMNLLVEHWGGKYQSQELSAKKGLNVDKLLEKILLEAEMLELKANADKEALGTVIEASLDKGRGYVATILVQNGTLKQGDLLVSGQYFGRIKAMFNERNQRVQEAPPSTPVVILGLNGAPQAGEKFKVYTDESEAKDIANKRAQILREQGLRARKHITLDEIGRRLALGNFKELNIIIKGDVDGSVEALSDSLQKLSTNEIAVNVVHKAVGQISESDVLLATASDAILIGFNVRPSLQANRLAQNEGVEIKMYSIIYNAIEEVKSAMEGMLEPKVEEKEVATVEIREVYKFDKATVAGCFVLEGKIKRDAKIRLFRDGVLLYPRTEGAFAELGSLKRYKDDAKDVASNMECGLTIKNFSDINTGDTIVAYEQEEIKRTL
jgi:translation initiation factor IF-2